MNITKYRSTQDEKKIFYGKASIIDKFKVANADEYCYQYLGKNSCYAFTELIHKDDVDSFIKATEKLEQGSQAVIARVKCYSGNYRCLCLTLEYNGRIVDGFKSYDINFSDTTSIQENYIKYLRLINKYRKFISLIPVLYFEYDFSTNQLLIYKYMNSKSNIIYNRNLDSLRDEVFSSEEMSVSIKIRFEDFYNHLIKGTEQIEDNMPAVIFDKEKKDIYFKLKTTVIYKDDSKDMVVGIMQLGENKDEEVYYLSEAARDVGTGLLNKRAISEYAIEKINESQMRLYLVMMDIDDFKEINDRFGHMVGDEVLIKVSEIIKSVLASRGTVGRFGGDEFLIVIENVYEEDDLRRILKTINKHIRWAYGDVFDNFKITTSMGITKFPEDGSAYDELFKKADKCLYIAKAKGKNRYIIYDEKKHGTSDANHCNNNLIGINSALNNEKKVAAISDIIISLYSKGIDAIIPSSEVIQAYFDVDGIAIYAGEDLKRMYSIGKYIGTIEQFKFLENKSYRELFNENDVYAETNIHKIERNFEEIFKAYQNQETAEFIQCITYSDDIPQVVVSFDVFNRTRKWSENDIDYLTILGKLIGEVIIKDIMSK